MKNLFESKSHLKLIITLLSVSLLLGTFVSVGFSASEEEITINWWYESVAPKYKHVIIEDLIEPYEESHENVDVQLAVKQQLKQVLRQAVSAERGPDIILTMGPAEANRYAAKDLLLPLDSYLEKTGLMDELAPFALETGRYKGKIYSLPKTFESMGIIYNKSLFVENGWEPPTNREEWVTLCEKMLDKGVIPVASGNSDWRPTNEWFVTVYLNHYAGPENVYKALIGEKDWDDPVFVEAIKQFDNDFEKYWLKRNNYYSLTQADFMSMVATRQAGMTVVGSWGFQWTANPTYWPSDDEWGWAPFPTLREGVEYPIVDVGIGTTLSVNKNSKHREETANFLMAMFNNKQAIGKLLKDHPGEWLVPYDIPEKYTPEDVDPVFLKHVETQSRLIQEGNYGYATWTFLGPETWQWCYEGIEQVWHDKITAQEYMEKWDEVFNEEMEAGDIPPIPARR